MGILYDSILKMRENGRSFKPTTIFQNAEAHKKRDLESKEKKTVENSTKSVKEKLKETAVKKNDNRTD